MFMSRDAVLRMAQFNPWLPVGSFFLYDFGFGPELWARHPAELTPHRMDTRWYVSGVSCPTWGPLDECRCMVAGC